MDIKGNSMSNYTPDTDLLSEMDSAIEQPVEVVDNLPNIEDNIIDLPKGAGIVDYDELYIRFPESLWAHLFSSTYGVPAFPAMYSNVYDSLPDSLRSLESANCIEKVCEFFYISGTVDSWKIA